MTLIDPLTPPVFTTLEAESKPEWMFAPHDHELVDDITVAKEHGFTAVEFGWWKNSETSTELMRGGPGEWWRYTRNCGVKYPSFRSAILETNPL